MGDNSGEPPLIKAIRKDRYDLLLTMLSLNRDKMLKYDEVLLQQDQMGRNVLHHAVMKSHHGLVKKLIYLDTDSGRLRGMLDIKTKKPMAYDDKAEFKEQFETIWDAAKNGNSERLGQILQR